MTSATLLLAILASLSLPIQQTRDPRSAGGGNCSANPYNCIDTPNPLTSPDTVWLEEMTWMDIRDAMKAGKTTIIVPTGASNRTGHGSRSVSTTTSCA